MNDTRFRLAGGSTAARVEPGIRTQNESMWSGFWLSLVILLSTLALLGLLRPQPAPAATLAAGTYNGFGVRADGSVVAWGWNISGQCNPPWQNPAPWLGLLRAE
jgi:hypothetical protein